MWVKVAAADQPVLPAPPVLALEVAMAGDLHELEDAYPVG